MFTKTLLKGNNGRPNVGSSLGMWDLLGFNPSKETTAVPTLAGIHAREAGNDVSTPQRKQRPSQLTATIFATVAIWRFNPSKETTAVPTEGAPSPGDASPQFQPLKGNNGRPNSGRRWVTPARPLVSTPQRKQRPSQPILSMAVISNLRVSTPQRKQRPSQREKNSPCGCTILFQPLKGNNGRPNQCNRDCVWVFAQFQPLKGNNGRPNRLA